MHSKIKSRTRNRTVSLDTFNNTTSPSLIKTQIKSELKRICFSSLTRTALCSAQVFIRFCLLLATLSCKSFCAENLSRAAGRLSDIFANWRFIRWITFNLFANHYLNIVPLIHKVSAKIESHLSVDKKVKNYESRRHCCWPTIPAMCT